MNKTRNCGIIEGCIFTDGGFNFRKLYSLFFQDKIFLLEKNHLEKIERRKIQEEKEERKKKKKLDKMIICRDREYKPDINPFFIIKHPEKKYKKIESLENVNCLLQDLNTKCDEPVYPFWFEEDERGFIGESISNIKNNSFTGMNKEKIKRAPFLILNDKESLFSIPINNIPQIKRKISDVIENTKRLSDDKYSPLEPNIQFNDHRKREISDQEMFMFQVMKCCEIGGENDSEDGFIKITQGSNDRPRRRFYYRVNFDRVKNYF